MKLRLSFDAGSGVCLWAEDAEAREKYGCPVELEELDLSTETIAFGNQVIAHHKTIIDWNDPGGPSPWTEADYPVFHLSVDQLLSRLRAELGDSFEIVDRSKHIRFEIVDTSKRVNERPRRLSRLSQFWPNVTTEAGRREASKLASFAIWWVAISYAVQVGLGIWAPDILLAKTGGGEFYEGELGAIIAVAALAVPSAVFLGWHFRKKTGLITGGVIALWLFMEVFFKLSTGSGAGAKVVITLLFSLGAVNGLRAAWATRKATAVPSESALK